MTIYYSATTNAFYDDRIYNANNIPEDRVSVSETEYKALLDQQCSGRVIVAGSDGYPTTIAQTCGSCTCTIYAKDDDVVHKTGNETIQGTKEFGGIIRSSHIFPKNNNVFSIGGTEKYYKDAYIYTLHGTSDRASNDSLGNKIDTTYATKTELSDGLNTQRVLIHENEFRNKALAKALVARITTLFVEVFGDTTDVSNASAVSAYYDAVTHVYKKTDSGTITIYSKAKTVTAGNNTAWLYADYTLDGGSIEFAISRDGGTTYTVLANNATTDISSQPAGTSMIMRVKMTGAGVFNNIAWGAK
jgi:hypothetical protein